MPKNYFANRDEDSMFPSRLNVGDVVLIIEKENQGTKDLNKLVKGEIVRVLSRPNERYKNGAKVKIKLSEDDWRYGEMGSAIIVGRVQYIVSRIDEQKNDYMSYVSEGGFYN